MHTSTARAKSRTLRSTTPCLTGRVARWFLESGIQQSSGGVARYYRIDMQRSQAVSTEITGYAAATLAYLHRLTGDPRCLEAAIRAGRFLIRAAWDPALQTMPFECRPENDSARAPAYFFDLGIVARSLAALWRATREAEFLETATACARAMASDFRGPSGCYAVLSLPDKQPLAVDGRWSLEPGCYQLKAAMAWLECGHKRLYETALAGFMTTHSFFLEAEPNRERLMDRLHAYCYFLEGLLPRATEPGCAVVLRDGIPRVGRLLREIAPYFERSDVWAQLLRLRLYAAALGIVPLESGLAKEEAARIRGFQFDHPDPRIDGAFSFGRRASELMPFANPASTAFCLQALEIWRQRQRGQFRPDPLDLI